MDLLSCLKNTVLADLVASLIDSDKLIYGEQKYALICIIQLTKIYIILLYVSQEEESPVFLCSSDPEWVHIDITNHKTNEI